jgi:hypothetical protein
MDRVAAENRGSRKTLSDKLTLTPLHRIHAHGRRQTRMPAPPVRIALPIPRPATRREPTSWKNRRIGPKRWKVRLLSLVELSLSSPVAGSIHP